MKEYQEISIEKESLDTIKAGDLVKVNDWKKGMRVTAVSPNFLVVATNALGHSLYSVIFKNKSDFDRNDMEKGYPIATPDDHYGKYNCSIPGEAEKELAEFESGELSWSRYGIAVKHIYTKRDSA